MKRIKILYWTFTGLFAFVMLGAAILFPGLPRIKEWAYAGLFIDLSGATYSILVVGASQGSWTVMLIPLTLGVLSYVFYHKKLAAESLQSITN